MGRQNGLVASVSAGRIILTLSRDIDASAGSIYGGRPGVLSD
jgi:hypothetical protein